MIVDAILFSAGRIPNVEGMGCDKAGVNYDKADGILVNDYFQTSNKDIYSVGDCIANRATNTEKDKQENPGRGP